MKGVFYISRVYDGWYQLCLRKTHFVLSCADSFDKVAEKLREVVRKYKTEERLMRVIRGLSDSGQVPQQMFDKREWYYSSHAEQYQEIVEDIVFETLKDSHPFKGLTLKVSGKDKKTEENEVVVIKPHVIIRRSPLLVI